MRSEGVVPELVLCSPARRVRETLELLEPALGPDVEVQIDDDLYGADSSELLERLRRVDVQITSVLVVGHNPGLQHLALELTGDGEEAAVTQLHAKFPTAALATLDVGEDGWDRLAPGKAYLTSLILARQLHERGG
jgi:phosphohistidine phosphatase